MYICTLNILFTHESSLPGEGPELGLSPEGERYRAKRSQVPRFAGSSDWFDTNSMASIVSYL